MIDFITEIIIKYLYGMYHYYVLRLIYRGFTLLSLSDLNLCLFKTWLWIWTKSYFLYCSKKQKQKSYFLYQYFWSESNDSFGHWLGQVPNSSCNSCSIPWRSNEMQGHFRHLEMARDGPGASGLHINHFNGVALTDWTGNVTHSRNIHARSRRAFSSF